MAERSVLELLAEHPFTSDLTAEDRQALAAIASIQVFEPDELLIREGRPATAFHLIVNGLAAAELFLPGRGVRRLQTIEAGSVAGWSWMLAPSRWEFDIRAMEQTTAIVLDGDRLREVLNSECCLGLNIVRKLLFVVAGRLKASRLQLLDMYGPPREVRR